MKNNNIFIDTGAWLATSDASDQYHNEASAYIKLLVEEKQSMITTNLVIHETFMLLSRRLSRKAAFVFLDEVFQDTTVCILYSNQSIEDVAFETLRKYTDQNFSVTDAVSFVIMQQMKIQRVFTFDKHFRTMLFTVEP